MSDSKQSLRGNKRPEGSHILDLSERSRCGMCDAFLMGLGLQEGPGQTFSGTVY